MNTADRITKAKIKLQADNPFFSYLSLFLKEQESKDLEDFAGMGVDIEGNLYYKKSFVDKLTDEELKAVLCHEILHLALLHLVRVGDRDRLGWNIATDLAVNSILERNSMRLPKGCLIPNSSDSFRIGSKTIKNISDKNAEQIYNELPKIKRQEEHYVIDMQTGKISKDGKGFKPFDEHKFTHADGTELTTEEKRELKEKWEQRISNAYVSAKQKGDLPAGIEQMIGKLHKEQVDWRTLLRRYLTQMIPSDFSWARRSKKSISTGYYLPDTTREKIKIAVVIDTSGSVSAKELNDFISEVVGMARAYKSKMDMKLYTHDHTTQDEYMIENGNIDKIMNLKLHGGGGTSHIDTMNKLRQEDYTAVVFFTDGYSDLDEIDFTQNRFQSIFIINKDGMTEQLADKNVLTIKLQ